MDFPTTNQIMDTEVAVVGVVVAVGVVEDVDQLCAGNVISQIMLQGIV